MESVLITGANKGLGFETARFLLKNGYYVYLGCRNEQLGTKAEEKLKNEGLLNCKFLQVDVTNQQSVNKAKAFLESKSDALDVLVNNAGILGRLPSPANPIKPEDIENVFATNFFGAIRVVQAFLPLLKKSSHPRIVNVTSDLASLTLHQDPSWKYFAFKGSAYGPSKTALNAYTVALAHQLRDQHFKVNCVTPGHTATDFNNYRGERNPEDTCKTIAKYAMLDEHGPTGKFFGEEGELPW